MEPPRYAWPFADDVVVEFKPKLEPAFGGPAAARVELSPGRIDEKRIVGRVELQVAGPEPNQLVRLLAQECGDVAEERLEARVGTGRPIRIPEVREEARARERHLEDPVGARTGVRQFGGRQEASPPKLPDDGDRRPADREVAQLIRVPVAPQKR